MQSAEKHADDNEDHCWRARLISTDTERKLGRLESREQRPRQQAPWGQNYHQKFIAKMRRRIFAPFQALQQQPGLMHKSQLLLCVLLAASLPLTECAASSSQPQPTTTATNESKSQPSSQNQHNLDQSQARQQLAETAGGTSQPVAQARVGLIAPSALGPEDFAYSGQSLEDAGDLEMLASQQQIPTAQLMSAAGHIVPENFFLPGGSIPASFYHQNSLPTQQQQRQQQQQHLAQRLRQEQQLSQQDRMVAETLQQVLAAARHVASATGLTGGATAGRYGRALTPAAVAPIDLLVAGSEQQPQTSGTVQPAESAHQAPQTSGAGAGAGSQSSLIDFNGYAMTTQPDPRDSAPHVDLLEFLGGGLSGPSAQQASLAALHQQLLYEHQLAALAAHHHQHHHQREQQQQQQQLQQQQQQQQHQHANSYANADQQSADHMTALASGEQQQLDEHYGSSSASVGPDYQLIGGGGGQTDQQYGPDKEPQQQSHSSQGHSGGANQRPYGLPTKSSSREPGGMLKPLGNPKTISSPIIDFVANNLPKQSGFEKLAEKMPAISSQPPTVFSFASQKDPVGDKAKAISSKKRTVMRQAEQLARFAIKSFNDKFGTNLGDQSDIPFLLSTLGPLGFAQNVLFDPTLLVTLLNTAEKTYFSDVLPGPAKSVVRPVLNIFRVPNKKRDKANLLNIISYLASGGQTSSSSSKHRQLGIEKNSNKKSSR